MNFNPTPARATPPGRILRRELQTRGWTQKDLAAILGRPETVVSEIVNGKKAITPETALGLAQALGTTAELWLNLEARYRLNQARKASPDNQVRRRSRVYSILPVKEMQRYGWIQGSNDPDELEAEVLSFLRVERLDDVSELKIAARRTATKSPDPRAVLAWVRRVEQLASQQPARRFEPPRLSAGMDLVLALTRRPDDVTRVPALLAELGVRLVIVPHLQGTYLDGALLETNGGPVVALTLRYDRLDSFWFTLVHELEHLMLGHRGSRLEDLDADASDDREEREADAAAAERLVPVRQLRAFVDRTKPYFSQVAITAFSEQVERHPAIVIGRLHHDQHVEPSHLRRLLPKVRGLLRPWIDTASPDTEVAPGSEEPPYPTHPTGRRGLVCDRTPAQTAVLRDLEQNPGWHRKAEIIARCGIEADQWRSAIAGLLADGCVVRTGQKRGTMYSVKGIADE
jgi:HTH-type transcriptional regulator/antitoxin HigA